MNSRRRAGKVVSIQRDTDHNTVHVMIEFDRFGTQGFGGLVLLEAEQDAFACEVADLFGVKRLYEIVGESCHGLWCSDEHNEHVEGLEVDGRRFTITAFRRKHFPDADSTALAKRQKSIEQHIANLKRQQAVEEARLATLEANWTEWADVPLNGAVTE